VFQVFPAPAKSLSKIIDELRNVNEIKPEQNP
jgi:hypothetical protein